MQHPFIPPWLNKTPNVPWGQQPVMMPNDQKHMAALEVCRNSANIRVTFSLTHGESGQNQSVSTKVNCPRDANGYWLKCNQSTVVIAALNKLAIGEFDSLTQHPMQLQIASQVIKRFFAPNVDKSVRLTVEFTILRETLETHALYNRVNGVLEEIGGPNITRVVNERFDTPETKTPPDSPFGRNSTATKGQQPES